jgi:hypothetical protein
MLEFVRFKNVKTCEDKNACLVNSLYNILLSAPRCPEPFEAFACICEEKNDFEKAHQVL